MGDDAKDETASGTKGKEVLHLMTQDDQPYGSQRRCCERCGAMIWGIPQPAWTDDRRVYADPPAGHVACDMARRPARLQS